MFFHGWIIVEIKDSSEWWDSFLEPGSVLEDVRRKQSREYLSMCRVLSTACIAIAHTIWNWHSGLQGQKFRKYSMYL